ncbi:MAG: hypothetical protein HEP71_18455 [Roseivirga sp.]|nr:hypothetical protein [Roseivirga sp.]
MTKTDRLSHYGILIIAISALVVSIWQVQLAHRHNKLTVKPYLRFQLSDSDFGDQDFSHRLSLINSGQGPAIIQSIDFEVEGKKTTNFTEALVLSGVTGVIGRHFLTTYDPGDVIEEKTRNVLFGINDIGKKSKPIHIKVVYESLYGDSFITEMDY